MRIINTKNYFLIILLNFIIIYTPEVIYICCYLYISTSYFGIVSDLQKSCEDSTGKSHMCHTQFSQLLTSYILIQYIPNNQWRNTDTVLLPKVHALLRFPQLLSHGFFLFSTPSKIPYYMYLSCLFRFLLTVTVFQTFLLSK